MWKGAYLRRTFTRAACAVHRHPRPCSVSTRDLKNQTAMAKLAKMARLKLALVMMGIVGEPGTCRPTYHY